MRINKNSMMHILRSAFAVFAAAAFIGCGDKTPPAGPETPGGGDEPGGGGDDPAPTELVGTLKTAETAVDGVVDLGTFVAGTAVTGKVYIEFDKAAEEAVTATILTDDALVADWCGENGKLMGTVPAAKVTVAGGGKLSAAAGDNKTAECEISLATDLLEAGDYMAAVTVSAGPAKGQAVYLKFALTDKPLTPKYPLFERITSVYYIDVSKWQPLLSLYSLYFKDSSYDEKALAYGGHIVNLESCTLALDASSGRALFTPSPDIQYVASNHAERLQPLRDAGQKVCVTVVPAAADFGFADLTDEQITDFTVQLKTFLDQYSINGVNLWNRGAKNSSPAQYAKLIEAIRKAVPNKLVTLADCGEAFDTGAIEVGKLVDYAWHTQATEETAPIFLDPWDGSNKYGYKPIAGMDKSRYGYVCAATTPASIQPSIEEGMITFKKAVQDWSHMGENATSNLIVHFNYRDNEQGEWEGRCNNLQDEIANAYFTIGELGEWGWEAKEYPEWAPYGIMLTADQDLIEGVIGYGIFAKDWE